jgi:16S rRNA processing protein RimM
LKDTPNDSLLLIGKVLRPHGLRGLLRIESYAHSRATFLEAGTLFIRAISGKLIEFTVSSVSPHKNSLLIKLDGLDQKEEAENLRGAEIFIKKGSLVRNEDEYFWHEILKLGVYLESGSYLGIVSQIISAGGNDIYVIKDGKREILIPATHEVVKKIDLENLSFTYSPDQITISGLTGIVNKSRFKDMNLTLELKKPYTMSIDSGTASIDIGTTISWARQFDGIRKKILPLRFGKGTIFLDSIQVAGPVSAPELWKFELAGTGKNMNLSASQYHDQIKNMSCRFNVTNHFVNLNELQGIIYDISWLSPMISRKDLDSFALPVTMEKGSLGSGYRGTFFRTCLKFAKGPELVMDMQGKKISDLFPVSLKISDSEFSDAHLSFSRDSDGPKFSFTGVLDTRTIDKMLVPESFWAGQLNNLTESQPVIIRKTDNGNLNISISHINLDSAFAESPALRFDIKTMPFKRIDLHADEIGIKKWIITNTDAALVLKNDTSYIRLKKAFLCDLDSTGFINLKGKTVQATVKFSAPDKPNIQKLLTCLFNDQHLMDGRYSLDIDMRTSADKNRLAESLNGSIKLEAAKGRIYKLTLLSRILSLLNISKIFRGKLPNLTQHGFAYETLFVDADIKNSRILLKKAIIDGNDMTLVFSGWIDPIKDDMNITCLISPFKTIDLIIKNIPVVNTLLGGRLISVPVKATGKLSDPDVMPLHPSAVGKGLINMMGTILKTPVKLWDKINGKK